MMRDVEAGGSYLSQNDLRLQFGLGSGEKIDSLEIRWSSGETEKISGAVSGKILTITKGRGITSSEDYRGR